MKLIHRQFIPIFIPNQTHPKKNCQAMEGGGKKLRGDKRG